MAEFRNATLQAAWEIVEAHYHRLCRCGNNGGGDCDACTEAYYAHSYFRATDDDPITTENTDD